MNKNRKLLPILILFFTVIISCKDENMKTEKFKEYIIKTPDNSLLTFKKVPYLDALEILNNNKYNQTEITVFGSVHKVYSINDMVLFEKTLNRKYYLLFSNEMQFKRYREGESYWDVSIFFDKEENIYSSFSLNCEKASMFLQQCVKKDKLYQIKGDNQIYTLYHLSDGSVCYLTHRINDWYDGYWFSNFDEFKYIYKNVLN